MRYAITGENPVATNEMQQEVADIAQDIATAEAWYAELVESERACDEISEVLENLHTISETLTSAFYSKEAIETLNIHGDLTAITRHATEDITPQIAQEDIKDKIKESWEAFKNFINKIIDAVGNFFAKLFNMASAQAQKIVDSGGNNIDFAAEKETLTFDQYKNLKGACDAFDKYIEQHIDIGNVAKPNGYGATPAGASDYNAKLNADRAAIVHDSNNTVKIEEGKVTIIDSALHREKKSLSAAGWAAGTAVELAKYFLAHKDKATRLGTMMKRLKTLRVNIAANVKESNEQIQYVRSAVRTEVSAYTCYAKVLRAFGRQVKCLNGAAKKAEKK